MDPYRRIARREIYRNPWLGVEVHDIVHPTGVSGEHVLIVAPDPVGVLVVDGETFVLERQPRFGAREITLEIVKGGADPGEASLDAARRELQEELGLEAGSWEPMGFAYEIPSIVSAPVALYLARNVRVVERALEDVEQIDAVRMPIEEAMNAAADGRIDDAVTVTALFRYARLARA